MPDTNRDSIQFNPIPSYRFDKMLRKSKASS